MIWTSYFAKFKNNPAKAFSVYNPGPPWSLNKVAEDICPSDEIAKLYKQGRIYDREFIERYVREILMPLNPQEIYDKYDGSVLLGYHKPESQNKVDNRFVVARWLERTLGVEIREL